MAIHYELQFQVVAGQAAMKWLGARNRVIECVAKSKRCKRRAAERHRSALAFVTGTRSVAALLPSAHQPDLYVHLSTRVHVAPSVYHPEFTLRDRRGCCARRCAPVPVWPSPLAAPAGLAAATPPSARGIEAMAK